MINTTAPGPSSAQSDWRSCLPELWGLPLLPCGACPEGKAPIDPATGKGLAGWQTAAFNPKHIAP